MLNISDEVKSLFLQDSTKKQLVIKVDSPDSKTISDFNYYTGNEYWYGWDSVINPDGFERLIELDGLVDIQWFYLGNVVRASMSLLLTNITSDPGTLALRCTIQRQSGNYDYLETTINTADYSTFNKADFYAYDTLNDTDPITKFVRLELHNTTATQFVGHVEREHYQIELANDVSELPTTFLSLYSKGVDITRYLSIPDITNDNLDFESFSMTESLCSQDNIKFGLCESAHCGFTTVNYNYDLKDRTIRPMMRVQGTPSNEDLELVNFWKDKSGRMPAYEPYERSKNATGGKVWTDNYLIYSDIPRKYFFDRMPYCYVGYQVKLKNYTVNGGTKIPAYFRGGVRVILDNDYTSDWLSDIEPFHEISEVTSDYVTIGVFSYKYNGHIPKEARRPYFRFYDSGKNAIDESEMDVTFTYSIQKIQVQPSMDNNVPAYDPDMLLIYNDTFDEYCKECFSDPVPLGVFHITDLKLEHQQNLVKQQVTAYDNILKLEQNAANWYTQYMFTVTTDDYQGRYDVEYARQIYSTFFDFAVVMGFDDRRYHTETLVDSWTYSNIRSSMMSSKRLYFQVFGQPDYLEYSEITVNDVNPAKLYMVDAVNYNGWTDEYLLSLTHEEMRNYAEKVDSLRRGLATNAGVIVEAYNSSGLIADYLLNRRDYFMLPEGTTYIKILVTVDMIYNSQTAIYPLIDSVSLYECGNAPELVNGDKNLFYYNYSTGEISDVGTSITGRDVVRSLLEVCGCFFRLDRQNGLPEFIYCTKGGLYPRNDLYPADDLFPRAGTDQTLPNGRYMSATQDNYEVQDYGKIQIIVDSDTNTSKSVCEMEYEGDNQSINTYLIDDNIFYSNKNMDVEYQYAYGLLQNMFARISSIGYVPNVTEAIGMPWIECGDRIGILTYTSGFESFIFRRTLKGIQLLKDTYESAGDEYTEAVKDFGYEEFN